MSWKRVLNGGDVSALVFDIGNQSLRVGYAKEEAPKFEIPAVVGVSRDANGNSATVADGMDLDVGIDLNITSNKKYYVDTMALNFPRNGMEIVSYMKDSVVEDWDLFEKVLDYTYSKCIQSKSECHPVLMSESPWNPRNKRQRLTEIMFEKYNVPAFFLVKNAVLAAFSHEKKTCLVVDSGATHTSAVPVQDGFVLTEAVVKSPIGGDYISMQCKNFFIENNIEIVPTYMIKSKDPVNEKKKAIWTKKKNIPEVTASWHDYMVTNIIQDFQSSILQVSEEPYDENKESLKSTVNYEFPHGYNQGFGAERFRMTEVLFRPDVAPVQEGVFSNSKLGVGDIVTTSVEMCDPDVCPDLYRNVVITGGNSLLKGFPERLNGDLLKKISPEIMLEVKSGNHSAVRRFESWIGGSILASLGTFKQMCISREDYEEGGKREVDKKCP